MTLWIEDACVVGHPGRAPFRGHVGIAGGIISSVSDSPHADARSGDERVDAAGRVLLPGFVDAHTHPVFVGTREDEFELRTGGATYEEIARAGGGILQSVRGVRRSSAHELESALLRRLERFLALGTTTLEAKSGYGLSLQDEERCLEAIRAVSKAQPLRSVERTEVEALLVRIDSS